MGRPTTLRDYLGEMAWYLDAVFDRREGGVEVFAGIHKWIVPCNWKIAAENFCGDSYHGPWSHRSGMSTGFSARKPREPRRAAALYKLRDQMPVDIVGVDLSHGLGDAEIHELGHAPFVEEMSFMIYDRLIGGHPGSLDHYFPSRLTPDRPCLPRAPVCDR